MKQEMEFRPRRSRTEAALIKECAAAHGVSARAVRAWRENEDGRWTSFLRLRAASPLSQIELPAGEANSTPADEEAGANRRFMALQKLADSEIAQGRIGTVPPLLKAASEAQKLLDSCRAARMRWDIARGEMFSRSDMRKIRSLLDQLKAVIANMPAELGPKACSFDPQFGIEVCENWVRYRYSPAVEKVLSELPKDSVAESASSDPVEKESIPK
jgi:hypothetical protein